MPRFPLDKRKLIIGFMDPKYKKYWGVDHHGADYEADHVPLYAHKDLSVILQTEGPEAGKQIKLNDGNGNVVRHLHLSRFIGTIGWKSEGELLGYTGNTGTRTSGPHLHLDVKDRENNWIDPEVYFNNLLNPGFMLYEQLKKNLEKERKNPGAIKLIVTWNERNFLGKLVTKTEKAIIRKMSDGQYKIRRNVSSGEFEGTQEGPQWVSLNDIKDLPTF